MATTMKESGAWSYALPMLSLGLEKDDSVVRVFTCLHLSVSDSMQTSPLSAVWRCSGLIGYTEFEL